MSEINPESVICIVVEVAASEQVPKPAGQGEAVEALGKRGDDSVAEQSQQSEQTGVVVAASTALQANDGVALQEQQTEATEQSEQTGVVAGASNALQANALDGVTAEQAGSAEQGLQPSDVAAGEPAKVAAQPSLVVCGGESELDAAKEQCLTEEQPHKVCSPPRFRKLKSRGLQNDMMAWQITACCFPHNPP